MAGPDLYRDLLVDYVSVISGGPQWRSIFARYNIGSALIERDSPLAAELAAANDWRLAYQDAVATVFLRESSASESSAR